MKLKWLVVSGLESYIEVGVEHLNRGWLRLQG